MFLGEYITTFVDLDVTPFALDAEGRVEDVQIFILTDVDDVNPFDIFVDGYLFTVMMDD
jgi:hypothetical protein